MLREFYYSTLFKLYVPLLKSRKIIAFYFEILGHYLGIRDQPQEFKINNATIDEK